MRCDNESIRTPGLIQPHGMMLALNEAGLVTHVSANVATYLGHDARSFLGRPLSDGLGAQAAALFEQARALPDCRSLNPVSLVLRERPYHGLFHRRGEQYFLELELCPNAGRANFFTTYHWSQRLLGELQRCPNLGALLSFCASEVRALTGFERVMIYRFAPNWDGEVVAESVSPRMRSYLGQRFPAADIPAQARELYTANWIRVIPDIDYKPVPVLCREGSPTDLDMSFCALRSVSPVHLQYMRNMEDAQASMSVSVLKDGKLWGLIACHHPEVRLVPYEVRGACEFLAQIMSREAAAAELRESDRLRSERQARLAAIQHSMRIRNIGEAIRCVQSDVLAYARASGAAFIVKDDLTLLGNCPTPDQVKGIVEWLRSNGTGDEIFSTTRLSSLYPAAAAFCEQASGILVVSPSRSHETYLIWFRPEVIRTIEWAGDPSKTTSAPDGRIEPRRSFELWKQTVLETSEGWQRGDIEAAHEFREALRAEQLTRSNRELAESNNELDSFAQIVSHDLKEPLRGIRGYIGLVLDEMEDLPEERAGNLKHAVMLSRRGEELLNRLYDFSRAGRTHMSWRHANLGEILDGVRESLRHIFDHEKVELTIDPGFPTVYCDSARIGEVFYNLILNATKYNDKELKRVRVGFEGGENPIFFVEDNGIGIAEKHRETVFRMFKRLHARDAFGGGTGAGLAIVKRIVDAHGGTIDVESEVGRGTRFSFRLNASQ